MVKVMDEGLNKPWYLKRINLLAGLSEEEIKYIDSRILLFPLQEP